MSIPTTYLKIIFILANRLVAQMDCTPHKFETIVQNFELFNSSRKLYNTKIIFGGANYIYLLSLLTNLSLTGQQDTSHPNAMKEKEDILFQNLSLQNLDYGNTYINCSFNSSCLPTYQRAPTFQKSAITKVILLWLNGLFSLVGNIATLAFILRTDRHSKCNLNLLQFYLALADLLVSVFCILTDAIWTLSGEYFGGNLLCKSVKFMEFFSLQASTNLQVLIGLDCLGAIRFPQSQIRAKHRVRMGLIFVWTISALFSLPQVFIFSVQRDNFSDKEIYQCVSYGFYTAQWQEQLYTTLSLLLMYLLPLAILLSTCIAIFRTITRRESLFSNGVSRSAIDHDARQTILWKANVNGMSFLVTVLLVFTFLVCWTPYYVTLLIFMFLDPREQMSRDLQEATFFFGCSTAAINPLIYGAFHHHRNRHSRSRSRSSPNIRSSSSMTDTTFHHINLKKNQAKSSKVESLSMHVIKGKVSNDVANV